MEHRWLYLIVIHFALSILSIGCAPTTEVAYTHDTSSGLSENKSRVDMTHIPFTDHHDDATPRNLSSQPSRVVQKEPGAVGVGKFAHETTTMESRTQTASTTEGGNGRTTSGPYVSEPPLRGVESILTTILYGSSTEVANVDRMVVTEHPTSTEEDSGRWKSTETYFINGLSDLLMENSGIDRIAEFVDEIANQQNSQLEKMDTSISTTDSTPPTADPTTVNIDPTTYPTSVADSAPTTAYPSTESVEKIGEQVTNFVAKNALNTELHGGGTTMEATTISAPSSTGVGNHIADTATEKNDSIAMDLASERPPVTSTISQFTPQFDILAVAGSTNAPEGSLGVSTKKPKSGKPKKKVSKTSVDTKKPFTPPLKSTAVPQGDLVHSTTPQPSTTTTTMGDDTSTTTYATEAHNEIQQTTEAPPLSTTSSPVAPSVETTAAAATTTPKGRRDWTGDDYAQPENEDDVLVVEIEDTDNFTEVPATRGGDIAKNVPPIEQSKPDMTDELFFPILVDRGGDTTTAVQPKATPEGSTAPPPQNAVNHEKTDTPIDRDSDTFFYISNTEVKVLESVPTPDTHKENNFFPEIYEEDVFIDFSNKNHSHRGMAPDKLEEDIILSPLNFDPMPKAMQKHTYNDYGKLASSFSNRNNNFNNAHDDATLEQPSVDESNLSISYIGESFIEIKESTTEMDSNNLISPLNSDVIIQPVAMPEVPLGIGVPVIGELPPQIELMPPADVAPHETQLHHDFDIDLRDTSHVFAHPGDYLVKNPSISAEVPILESSTAHPGKRNGSQLATGQTPFVDDGDLDTSMSEFQTLSTACVATLTLLIVVVGIVFGVRYLWRKYRPDQLAVNGLIADSSTDPLAIKSRTLSTDELKSADSEYTINRSSDTLESTADQVRNTCNGAAPSSALAAKSNHTTGANGSVITMTLKNNHLIVETEERNDISRDARETKMHYSPSEKDGVFVVEVARGADSTGLAEEFSKNSENILQKSNIEFTGPGVDQEPLIKIKTDVSDHQEVQIHDPPPPVEKPPAVEGDEGKGDKLLNHSKTGLTQSVLSMSSSNGSNKDYCYGSQEAYTVDTKGYKGSSPRFGKNDGQNDPETASNSEEGEQTFINRKPIVTGAIYKQDTLDFESSIPLDTNDVTPGKHVVKEEAVNHEKHELGNGVLEVEEENEKGDEPIVNGEAEKESFTYPEPPSSEEIKCLSDTTIIENNMDSLPPPPPIDNPDEQLLVSES